MVRLGDEVAVYFNGTSVGSKGIVEAMGGGEVVISTNAGRRTYALEHVTLEKLSASVHGGDGAEQHWSYRPPYRRPEQRKKPVSITFGRNWWREGRRVNGPCTKGV